MPLQIVLDHPWNVSTPVFLSSGHRIDLDTAITLVLDCARRYRLPEPTRWAHRVAGGAEFPVGT